jgi:glucose/arabinose dehydrogenase
VAIDAVGDEKWPAVLLASPITGFDKPVQITHAGDASGRLFVIEQTGRIHVIKNGALLETPYLDITDRISCCGERGLLGVAFPPDFANVQHFYVSYTDTAGDSIVARYRVSGNTAEADASSEQVVLAVQQPYRNHNGGQLAFGPNDGYLYIGLGDGGAAGDPGNRAQDPESLLGKVLRIDVEIGNAQTYAVPSSNPYAATAGYRGEIWALGLRNPWRFSFDSETGDLYVGDVGQNRYEEIDFQRASSAGGENYGWRIMEGSHCFNPQDCDSAGLILPVVEYEHTQGNCSVTGGRVYRGTEYPVWEGIYFYADYCTGRIWGLKRLGTDWENRLLHEAGFRISSFGVDEAGNLWVARYDDGTNGAIYRVAEAALASYLPLILR